MSRFISYESIRYVQIDTTSRCNLLCPQCARTFRGKINPNLDMTELSPDDYHRIFEPSLLRQLQDIHFNGNYGDPAASGSLLQIFEFLRSGSSAIIRMSTNGSLRDKNWWRELGSLLSRDGDIVAFGIDGLSDTNHLYRINSNYERIIENARAFIQAGGRARWDYLVFEHNEYQIESARKMALDLGFKSFALKHTTRFFSGAEFKSGKAREGTAVQNQKSGEFKYWLKPPKEERAAGLGQFEKIINKYGSWSNYIAQTPIDCIYQRAGGVFIDFRAFLWPCTWLGAPDLLADKENLQRLSLEKHLGQYELGFNDLRKKSIREVLEHPWFSKDLVESWTGKTTLAKLVTCGRTCGSEFNFTSATGKNIQDKSLPPATPPQI